MKQRENWATSPKPPPRVAPAPTSGGSPTASPVYPWPFRPHKVVPPSAEPSASPPAVVALDKGGGIPFINSNPAVPLPTGEVDSATLCPVPTSGHERLLQVLDVLPLLFLLFFKRNAKRVIDSFIPFPNISSKNI